MARNVSFAQSLGDKACRNEGEGVRYHLDYDGKVERWRWYMVQCAVCRLLYCFSLTTQTRIKDIVLALPLSLSAAFVVLTTVLNPRFGDATTMVWDCDGRVVGSMENRLVCVLSTWFALTDGAISGMD